MDNRIYKLYNIADIGSYKGVCTKCECTINGEKGIFKQRMNGASKDHIIEAIVYNIALICNVDCAFAKVRQSKDIIGVFSRFEMKEGVSFEHASVLYGKAEMHAEELFNTTGRLSKKLNSNLVYPLYKYLVFDYLVGQQDRHLENLALIKEANRVYWYKLYDNGLALKGQLGNDAAIQMLKLGYYDSRMGSSKDILQAIRQLGNLIPNSKYCIDLSKIDFDTIYSIIDKCDIYKEIIKERRVEMANFIVRQSTRINEAWRR